VRQTLTRTSHASGFTDGQSGAGSRAPGVLALVARVLTMEKDASRMAVRTSRASGSRVLARPGVAKRLAIPRSDPAKSSGPAWSRSVRVVATRSRDPVNWSEVTGTEARSVRVDVIPRAGARSRGQDAWSAGDLARQASPSVGQTPRSSHDADRGQPRTSRSSREKVLRRGEVADTARSATWVADTLR
jgi:hypothetical protein